MDFCILTGIKEPEKTAMENWGTWVSRIFCKGKIEAQDHKKTYQDLLVPMEEMAKVPLENLSNRMYNYNN